MRVTPKNIKMFQVGGPIDAPAEEGAPVEEAGAPEAAPAAPEQQDPMMQIASMMAQGLQNQDCQMLAQACQMFLELLQQAQGGGAPEGPNSEPIFKKGGILVRRVKK